MPLTLKFPLKVKAKGTKQYLLDALASLRKKAGHSYLLSVSQTIYPLFASVKDMRNSGAFACPEILEELLHQPIIWYRF